MVLEHLHTKPITKHLGVQVLDLNPNKTLTNQEINELNRLIDTHHLVLLKSTDPIQKQAQVQLTKQLGDAWKYDFIPGQYKEFPEIFKVTNQKGDGFTNAGQAWHSDGSIYNKRMHLSIFSIDSIPIDGASTYFSSLTYALERLPKYWKERFSKLHGFYEKMYQPHPVVWNHPITNEALLHVSEGFENGFLDSETGARLSKEESMEIHQFINEHMWQEATFYEHQWQQGDLLIADNYAVAHFAKPNYSNTLRVLHRTATKGEKRKRSIH